MSLRARENRYTVCSLHVWVLGAWYASVTCMLCKPTSVEIAQMARRIKCCRSTGEYVRAYMTVVGNVIGSERKTRRAESSFKQRKRL